jgi:hypothetical protein
MARESDDEKKGKGFLGHMATCVAWSFAFVALYVLSSGPVAKYACVQGTQPSPVLIGIYAPLDWVCEKSHIAELATEWYVVRVWRVQREE